MKLTQQQSYKVQLLRGLAIIAVVFIHNTPNGIEQVYLRPWMNFAVGLFLFLSGLLTSAERFSPYKRIKKVLIPYAIWTVIYVVLQNITTPAFIPIALIKSLLTGSCAAIMYYIFVYCQLTLLVPLIDRLAKSKLLILGFLIAPIEIIVMRMLPLLTKMELPSFLKVIRGISCLGWFNYFYLGYLIGNQLMKVKVKKQFLWGLLVFAIALQMVEGYWYYLLGDINCGTQLKLSAILTGGIFVVICYQYLISEYNVQSRILYTLGNYSFGIYFSHLVIMQVLMRVPYYSSLFFPIRVLIVLLVSCCCISVGKKILGKYAQYLAL